MVFDFDVPEDYEGGLDLEGYFHPALMIHSPHFTHDSFTENGQRFLRFSPPSSKASAIVLPPSFLPLLSSSSSATSVPSAFTVTAPPNVGTGQPVNVQVEINEDFFNNAVNSSRFLLIKVYFAFMSLSCQMSTQCTLRLVVCSGPN